MTGKKWSREEMEVEASLTKSKLELSWLSAEVLDYWPDLPELWDKPRNKIQPVLTRE